MKINNMDKLDEKFIWKGNAGLATLNLGSKASSERIYVNVDRVPPELCSTKYHSHSAQEEFFLILGGSGTLRLNGKEYKVCKGDFIAKPAGRGIAHQFINTGNEVLEILDVGTAETQDVCHYPDEGVYLLKSGNERRVLSEIGEVTGWTSNPNE